jgi:hypothetical protein
MSLKGARCSIFGLALLIAISSMNAQSWHLETPYSPRSPEVVNDSHKTIEAYSSFHLCPNKAFTPGKIWHDQDALDSSGITTGDMKAADGKQMHSIGIEPGGRWIMPGTPGQIVNEKEISCELQVDAILFTDGSYEGDEASVRALQARRDGIRASVNYWSEKFNIENPDPSDFATLRNQAKDRLKQERDIFDKYLYAALNSETQPLSMAYWNGRIQVDQNVEHWISDSLSGEKALKNYQRSASDIARWQKKIETDISMQNLSAEFPPVTEDSVKPENLAAQE